MPPCAVSRGIPVLTCMGTGNHLDPSRFVIGDIETSSVCPLARVMRAELRSRGIRGVTALWSTEPPLKETAPDGTLPSPNYLVIDGDTAYATLSRPFPNSDQSGVIRLSVAPDGSLACAGEAVGTGASSPSWRRHLTC